MRTPTSPGRTVILGVAASDSHAVANHLIAHVLRAAGYTVVNLGTCTPVREFAEACAAHPDAVAVVVGSLNGHAREDLHDLPAARRDGLIRCPVLLGGNLSVGSRKDGREGERLLALGVNRVLADPGELVAALDEIVAAEAALGSRGPLARRDGSRVPVVRREPAALFEGAAS